MDLHKDIQEFDKFNKQFDYKDRSDSQPGHIYFWGRHDKYGRFLSNFARYPIEINNRTWPTTEHYYQAMKSTDFEYQEQVRCLETPKEAKVAGNKVKLRPDWEDIKETVMLEALRAKFSQWKNLRKLLLETNTDILHEDSPWDMYWGYCEGKGKDRLGVLLMQVREELGVKEVK